MIAMFKRQTWGEAGKEGITDHVQAHMQFKLVSWLAQISWSKGCGRAVLWY